jgi:guanylate kinase
LGKFFVITGPSAVGKTTLARELLKTDLPITKVITTTTRPVREGEVDGREYHFVTKEEFLQMIEKDEMFEWAIYNGEHYGSQKRDVENVIQSRKSPLWVVDVRGAEFLRENYPEARVIFIVPSSFEILRTRLENRDLPKEEIRNRLKIAREEIAEAPRFTYRVTNYDGKLEKIVEEAVDIIRKELSSNG